MVNENEGLFRPYAPPANMQALLHRLRRMNMPASITRDLLKSIGISENIIPRLFATLRFLALITDKYEPTDVLRGLAGSTEDEFRQLLEKTVRAAYADDFYHIDPGQDTQERVMNAFQRYTPRSQHSRQVMLFLGLCREAGIPTLDVPRKRGMRGRSQTQRPVRLADVQRQVPRHNGKYDMMARHGRGEEYNATMQFLGITSEDAALMPEEDFWAVWGAIGTVFLRRSQRTYLAQRQNVSSTGHDAQGETAF